MINLLPQKHQELLNLRYRLNRLTIASYFVVALSLISLSFFAFGYFLTQERINIIVSQNNAKELTTSDGEMMSGEDVSATIANLSQTSRLADEIDSKLSPSAVYETIQVLKSKPPSVHVYEMSYSNKLSADGPSKTLILKGVADNRDGLVALGKFLDSVPEFKEVDLPISNFAKESNIDFSLIVTLK